MYGLPKSGLISHDALVKHLEHNGYIHSRKPPGLWIHGSRLINFTLIFDDFGVKYSGKQHFVHLKASLEDKYKATTEREGQLFIGIALKWDLEKCTFQISMSGYACEALH